MSPFRIFLFSALPVLLMACCPVPREGEKVQLADQSAIVVWNSQTKTEDFIRRADFKTSSKDFGFLVPTPSKPELSEVTDEVFATLAEITKPRVVKETVPKFSLACEDKSPMAMKEGEVNVLDLKRVGGFDAAVLESDKVEAIDGWLKKNGYNSSPEVVEWMKPYILKRWILTAFKIVKEDVKKESLSTTAVRMSFHTETPYFPYRVPTNAFQGLKHQFLRVYFLGDEKVEAQYESAPWKANLAWANSLQGELSEKALKLLDLSNKTWKLTEFEDLSWIDSGRDDVFFTRASNQSPVERNPTIVYVDEMTIFTVLRVGMLLLILATIVIGPLLILRFVYRRIVRSIGKS